MRFTGRAEHTLDDKGRVILPARFREQLASGFYLVPGSDRCVEVLPVAVFEDTLEALERLPESDPAARARLRRIASQAYHEVPDSQGRVTVPSDLRHYAGLERDLMVTGAGKRVEIWDRGAFEAYEARNEDTFVRHDRAFGPAGAAGAAEPAGTTT